MAVQINVAANQAALTASIQAGVQAYNQRFAQNNPINLSINQRAFSQPLGRMTGDVKDFEAALAASNARVIAFGASTAVLGGVIRSFKELANVTIDVEKNLADINRVFGLTTSQLQKFSTDLFSVGKQTASSFDDASKAALEFSRQGLKAEEVLIRTKDALTLARVAGISTANSVDALTSTINGFAATGVTTTQILNKLVAVEQDFAVGAGDLAEALSRTGQAAQEAGVSLDQLNALVTAAQQSTARGGAVIGNALKTIFTRLQRTETLDQLEAFNIAVRDVQGNTLPAVTVLQNFAGAYKNLGDAQRAQLSEQVAGVYQVNILKAIVGDLNKSQGVYAGALQRGASATNEAEVATAKLNQTLDALLKQTATSTQQLANNIGKVTFEPLARYGTEQLKSLVESMNEILEGEGVGSTFANGLLKGIRNVIAGPGAIAAFFTLFKLIQNSFTYLAQALPQIAGITTETQNRKNIEQSILQIMQQQGPVSQALAGSMGNQAAQAQLLLQLARQQTAEYQIQSTLAKQLATQLAGQGVRVKGSGGLQVTRAGGYIPAATRIAEAVGAQAGGYAPGKVVKSPVGGVMNTAEDVKYVPGFAQPFINPPAGSKAGRAHRENSISRTGVDPYMFRGFIPNFANTKYFNKNKDTLTLNATEKKPFVIPENQELAAVADINKDSVYGLQYKIKLAGSYSRFSGAFDKKMLDSKQADTILLFSSLQPDQRKAFIENYKKYVSSKEDFQVKPFTANKKETINFSKQLQGVKSDTLGNLYELYLQKKFNLEKNPNQTAISDLDFVDAEAKIGDFSSANLLSKAIRDNAEKKGIERPYYKNGKYNKINLNDKALTLYTTNASKGFIPNFATPVDSARIPWFKKYASSYKNTASDKDIFRQIDFPTYGKGLDHSYAKIGNPDMVSFLYEDFVRSAMNIALGSKQVVRSKEAGFKNTPTNAISNRDPIDLAQKISGAKFRMLEVKQSKNNQKETISQISDAKLRGLFEENPELAKNVELMSIIFNDPRYVDPTGKNPAGILSPFEQSIAPIVKNSYADVDSTMRGKLGLLTDGLMKRYQSKKNSFSKGFIPNFASMISSSIKGKGNISAIKTGKNDYEIEGVEVGKKFRGQGLGSQLYGNIAQKIGSGSTIKSVLLPQEQALADYASGKSIPAKAIFPQLSWAKMAKSSKLLINGKEIAMSDFESGIAAHKYNAAKLDMALIELVNSHASGFIPNFAYQQAVMSLEEGMSGEKAIFDTKPFPHIRNKSQPTFSSAVADHGGLSNALSDSMRGQKDAGLMSGGFMPNFATLDVRQSLGSGFNQLTTSQQTQFLELNRALSQLARNTNLTAQQQNALRQTIRTNANALEVSTGSTRIVSDANRALAVSLQQNGNAQQRAAGAARAGAAAGGAGGAGGVISKAFNNPVLAMMTPIITSAIASQFAYGDKKRSELTGSERGFQNAANTGVTSISTGAFIGNMILPGWGAAIGAGVGALIGLREAINATKLSVEELTELNQEQTQKAQANIAAASSYIEAQKSLTQMISSGVSSSDIEIATKKLSDNFNEIKDVNLQEIFNATGGDVKKMTEELQKYTNETTKKSATKRGLLEKVSIEDRISALNIGLDKEQKKSFVQNFKNNNFRKLKEQKEKLTLTDQIFRSSYVEAVDTANYNFAKQLSESMLNSVGITAQTDPNFEGTLKASMSQILAMSISQIDQLIAGLEKGDIVSEASKATSNFKQAATRSFNQIFLDMEQIIATSAFDVALSFEKDSGSRRIQSAILDFSMNFQDSLNSFISNNLPDARKFDFTIANAGQKAQMLLQKSQQDYDKAIAEQANEKSIFLTKNSEKLMEKFKSSFLPSQASAEFFQSNTLPQIQAGTFTGDAKSLSEQFKNASFEKAKTEVSKADVTDTLTPENINAILGQITEVMTDLAKKSETNTEEYKQLQEAQKALTDSQNQTALFQTKNEMTKLQNVIINSVREQQTFEQKQENAKKEAELNKQLTDVKIKADKLLATEKAAVDKQNLMRLEKMKNVSAAISNNLEIFKATSNAKVNTLQGDLADPRLDYGSSAKEVTGRKIAIESQILKTQRAEEDAAINAEIQQRVLQMAAEQENTSALYALSETIGLYMGKLLEEDLGGASVIAEMQNNPYTGKGEKDLFKSEQEILSASGFNPDDQQQKQLDQINQARSYSPTKLAQFEAYQRTQQSKTSANVIDKLDAKGFNARGVDGKLLMTQEDQLKTLNTMSEEYAKSGDVVAKGIVDRYKAEIINKKTSLAITRENIDQELRRKQILEQQSHILTERFKKGYSGMSAASDRMIEDLVERTPERFADGMTNALMEVAKGTKSIGDAFKDMAINFGQEIMQAVMRAAIGKMVGSAFTSLFGQAGGSVTSSKIGRQTGGVIHAQNGMYISGGRTGDKNPAMLEDGEYVLNREAVKAFGGVNNLDKMNYDMAPRFGKKMQGGGSVDLFAEMGNNKKGEYDYTGNLMSGSTNIGAINPSDYTAYAYAESDYFKKMREKSVADEQERVQKKFEKDQKNAQLISSIVGAVGSLALAGGMAMNASQAAASATSKVAESATTVSETASDAVKKGFETAKETGGKALTDFMKANPESVLVNGKSLSYLQSVNQVAKGLPSQAVTGQFSRFGGNAQLTGILNQQGFKAAEKTAGSGFFNSLFSTGISTTGANVRKGRQTGGLIAFNSGGFVPYGSRLSDTIPALLTGGEYVMNNTAVKKYGLGTMSSMNAGAYQEGGSTATSSNNTNNNATNIAINIDKSGKSVYGADTSSYEKQDIVLTKQMAKQINGIVLRSMSNEKRYGGELYKNSSRT